MYGIDFPGYGAAYHADCFDVFETIPDGSIDMILCDLPYGTTQCKWDSIIPFELLWKQYNRIIKDNGAIVLFGSEPFTSKLICSNIKNFKYNWIWQKSKSTDFLNAKKRPLNDNETISVFYKTQCVYNPQMTKAERIHKRRLVIRDAGKQSDCYGKQRSYIYEDNGLRYPKRIQYFNNIFTLKQLHPTQKPVELLEYMIRTYSNEGDLVLDNCAGSFSTAIACMNENRLFIGIEKEKQYFDIGIDRIRKHIKNIENN